MPSAMTCYLTCYRECSQLLQLHCTGSSLKLHLFDGVVIFEIMDWEERKFSYVLWTPSFFATFNSIFVRACFDLKFLMSGCATSFPKNPNHIDRVNHVNHRPNFF